MKTTILRGDVREMLATLTDESVHCCVTSPPYYGLRDYGVPGQLGLEPTLAEYLDNMVAVFREVRRVLRSDGTLWLNIGDSYAGSWAGNSMRPDGGTQREGGPGMQPLTDGRYAARNCYTPEGLKPKDLMGVPWRLAFALQADGWYLRSDIIWHKKSTMPESVRDRPTKSHEHIFLLAKSEAYFYDQVAASEPVTQSTVDRCSQESWDEQEGSGRVPGKTNGNMKAVVSRSERRRTFRGGAYINNSTFNNSDGGKSTEVGNEYVENATRNWRDVWSLGPEPFKEAHFATFPTEIPRRAVVAGTSEKGCCAACGSPWTRVSEIVGRQVTDAMRYAGGDADGEYRGEAVKNYEGTGAQNASDTKRRILERMGQVREHSWEPSCSCDGAETRPAVVLDPFLGSGTTALVADRLQRDCIGIELNPAYADMAERRIRGDAPLFAEVA